MNKDRVIVRQRSRGLPVEGQPQRLAGGRLGRFDGVAKEAHLIAKVGLQGVGRVENQRVRLGFGAQDKDALGLNLTDRVGLGQ